MEELKPCPFCGNLMDSVPRYTLSYNREKKKRNGIYYRICTMKCGRCTCSVSQAGATFEQAKDHVFAVWNRRVE